MDISSQQNELLTETFVNQINFLKKELSELKKENFHLKQYINELIKENTKTKASFQQLLNLISSIPIISQQLFPKNNKSNTLTIKDIQIKLKLDFLHSDYVFSAIQLSDQRIATGGGDGNITVSTIHPDFNDYSQDVLLQNAHSKGIRCLCEINNKLFSCSNDKTIKIWLLSKHTMKLIKTISTHHNAVYKIIKISEDTFASCSEDNTVKIILSNEPYTVIKTLIHSHPVYSIIKLTNKDILISSCSLPSIDFWDLQTYQRIRSIEGIYAFMPSHMIELSNGNVAVSLRNGVSDCKIAIIDTEKFCVIKEIVDSKFIADMSSLCVWDNDSFVFVDEKKFVQISMVDYTVKYKKKFNEVIGGYYGILNINKGECLGVNSFGRVILLKSLSE